MIRSISALTLTLALLSVPALAGAVLLDSAPKGPIHVAFVLTDGATMIDFAGPWEVFQDVMIPDRGKSMEEQMPFQLFTVGASRAPIQISGGMTVTPDYTFANAPAADIVVVGAQRGAPGLSEWLKKQRSKSRTVMSVCTGAFKLADAGLFDGKQATTHHGFYDQFEKQFPNVTLVRNKRFVQADPVVFSAGGLTSGIDLALHVVELYFGREVAQHTADYMEYTSTGWRD